jgi:hypothetical protein
MLYVCKGTNCVLEEARLALASCRELGKGIRAFKRATEHGADAEDTEPQKVES